MPRLRKTQKELSDALETTKVDPFAQLPTEILSMILEYNQDVKLPTAPISRSLLPFQRLAHFETCLVTSVGAFLRVENLVHSDKALADSIKIFNFRLGNSLASIPLAKLSSFLSTLTHLESLTLLDFGPNSSPFLPQSNLIHSLSFHGVIRAPHLKHLSFRIPSDWPHPFDPRRYQFLDRFPSLVSLEIIFDHADLRPKIASSGPSCLSRITSLSILGGNKTMSTAIADFVKLFPNLDSFEARKTCRYDDTDFEELVPLLPDTLKSLAIEPSPFRRDMIPFDTEFPRFQALETLTLGSRTFSQNVLTQLKQLPLLRTLTFEHEAYPPLKDLSTRNALPPSLKKIEMNQIRSGKIGSRIEDPFAPLPPNVPLGKLGPGWVLPDLGYLKRLFTLDSLRETVETLRGFGIVVEGSAVEAMRVDEEGLIEIKHVETVLAIGCGDFVGLKKKYGEEWTKAAKEERRRRKKVQDLVKKERAEARSAGKVKQGGRNAKKKGGGKKQK